MVERYWGAGGEGRRGGVGAHALGAEGERKALYPSPALQLTEQEAALSSAWASAPKSPRENILKETLNWPSRAVLEEGSGVCQNSGCCFTWWAGRVESGKYQDSQEVLLRDSRERLPGLLFILPPPDVLSTRGETLELS